MQKFENVDVIPALSEIMRQNTAFYQSDFDIDKAYIQKIYTISLSGFIEAVFRRILMVLGWGCHLQKPL